jgi:hypothetical protein
MAASSTQERRTQITQRKNEGAEEIVAFNPHDTTNVLGAHGRNNKKSHRTEFNNRMGRWICGCGWKSEQVGKKRARRNSPRNQNASARATLKSAFRLSEVEDKFVVNAKIGQGILVTQEGRIPFYNLLSDEERKFFTTRLKEVTI